MPSSPFKHTAFVYIWNEERKDYFAFLVFETVFSTKSTTAHESVRRCFECSYRRLCYACCTAVNFHVLGPTGRVKVQYSSNSMGSALLPLTTFPLF